MVKKTRYIPVLIYAFVLVAILFHLSCKRGEFEAPETAIIRTVKLIAANESWQSGDEFPDGYTKQVVGEYTVNNDTRPVLKIGHLKEFKISMWVKLEGQLKFACALSNDAFKYGKEFTLHVNIENSDGETPVGEITLNSRNKESSEKWTEVVWDIPEEAPNLGSILFKLEGAAEDTPPEVFCIAQPTLVNTTVERPFSRIILIGVDTLRADHLGCYDYERNTSPNIDAFTKEGALFDRCISTCPWTFPAFASILTGKYPSIAGAVTNVKYLPDKEDTLAENFSELGFATFEVVNSHWLSTMTNLHQGFDVSLRLSESDAIDSFNAAVDWLELHSNEDTFVFIHLMDPHRPYKPKPGNLGKFGSKDYTGPYQTEFMMAPEYIEELRAGNITLPEEDWTRMEALYDEEILGLDQDFGAFIDGLKAGGFYDNSLIIFTADHGEEFREHGGYEHGHSLYDEVIRVPLIIKGGGFTPGARIDGLCSNMDIFPTVLSYFSFGIPDDINGKNLFDLVAGGVEPESRMLLGEQLYYGIEQKGVSTDRYRYILHTGDGSEELYDFGDDREMLLNVAPDRRAKSREFRYFAKEVALNSESGWHIRFFHLKDDAFGKEFDVVINAPGGFAEVKSFGFDDADILEQEGDTIRLEVRIGYQSEKSVTFSTPDEDVEVSFDIKIDGADEHMDLIHIGPNKEIIPYNIFALKITDERFGLGIPNFQQGREPGTFIWGNSLSLREELTPEIGDKVREELRALGYLQ